MYAVIESGGKQYRVSPGEKIQIERLALGVGDQVSFDNVLFVSDVPSTASLSGARVLGTVLEQGKGDKILVLKFKRRKMYRRKQGHRQLFTRVLIDEIQLPGAKKPAAQKNQKTARVSKKSPATTVGEARKQKVASGSKDLSSRKTVSGKRPSRKTSKAIEASQESAKKEGSTKRPSGQKKSS